jgi:hypothetical protein
MLTKFNIGDMVKLGNGSSEEFDILEVRDAASSCVIKSRTTGQIQEVPCSRLAMVLPGPKIR